MPDQWLMRCRAHEPIARDNTAGAVHGPRTAWRAQARVLPAASLHECCCLHTPGSSGITRQCKPSHAPRAACTAPCGGLAGASRTARCSGPDSAPLANRSERVHFGSSTPPIQPQAPAKLPCLQSAIRLTDEHRRAPLPAVGTNPTQRALMTPVGTRGTVDVAPRPSGRRGSR
jgi:hypothetical protein